METASQLEGCVSPDTANDCTLILREAHLKSHAVKVMMRFAHSLTNVLTGISCFRRRRAALRRGDAL